MSDLYMSLRAFLLPGLLLLLSTLLPITNVLASEAIEVGAQQQAESGESLEVLLEASDSAELPAEDPEAAEQEISSTVAGDIPADGRIFERYASEAIESISLEEALRRALEHQPMLDALQSEVYAAEGRMLQGSLKPNPEVEAEIAEFMGTAEMRFFRSAATGVGFSQVLERSRKRTARMLVAEQEGELALSEIELARTEIMYSVVEAYFSALAAQERLKLASERELLAQQVNDLVALRVEGGKSARLELTRSSLELSGISLERRRLELELNTALNALASLWGADLPDFAGVEGSLDPEPQLPEIEELDALLSGGPQAERWEAERELSEARRLLASAEGETDLTVRGGLTRYEETDSFGFHIGVSMPIARNNRNQGAVIEAQSYIEQVEQLREAELLERRRELDLLYSRLIEAYFLADKIETSVMPLAQESYELTQEGYRYGKFSLLDVLDAQRTLLDAREQHGEALISYQLTLVQIEALVAQPLTGQSPASEEGTDSSGRAGELPDQGNAELQAEDESASFFVPAAAAGEGDPLIDGADSPEPDTEDEIDAETVAVAAGDEEAGNE